METKFWNGFDDMEEAARLLKAGEVVGLPTETVYGLGADARNELAVQKIFQAKGRPSDNPLIVHVANKEQLCELVAELPPYAEKLIHAFSPGPITYVLPSNGRVAPSVSAGLQTVGIRIPSHPLAQKLLRVCGFPLAAPSANLSGKPSPTEARHVWDDLQGKIAGIIDGGQAESGLESTVVDCTGPSPVILRPGEITAEQIGSVAGSIELHSKLVVDQPKSPGMKYKHYAPAVPLDLYIGYDLHKVMEDVSARSERLGWLTYGDQATVIDGKHMYDLGEKDEQIAHQLYRVLRLVSKEDIDKLICVLPNVHDLSAAIIDRLTRAATKVNKR